MHWQIKGLSLSGSHSCHTFISLFCVLVYLAVLLSRFILLVPTLTILFSLRFFLDLHLLHQHHPHHLPRHPVHFARHPPLLQKNCLHCRLQPSLLGLLLSLLVLCFVCVGFPFLGIALTHHSSSNISSLPCSGCPTAALLSACSGIGLPAFSLCQYVHEGDNTADARLSCQRSATVSATSTSRFRLLVVLY